MRMAPQIVLITGCSSGIGLATAVLFARDAARRFVVYATVLRPIEEETEFRMAAGDTLNNTLFPVIVDVTKTEMISSAISLIMKKHSRIDIVVNNAGINVFKVTETIDDGVMKRLYDVNFFGMFRVTREVLPIMKRQRSGRIISLSSLHGALRTHVGAYASAKFAIEGLSEELAVIGRFYNIWVSVVQPGPVTTSLKANMLASQLGGEDAIRADPMVQPLDKQLVSCWDHELDWIACPNQSADEAARVVLKAATDEKPHLRYQTSEAVARCVGVRYRDVTGDSQIDYQVERLRLYVEKINE